MTFSVVDFSEDLDLSEFYSEALRRGYVNNSSQKRMIDCFNNEREFKAWILYNDGKAVGSVAAHSFDDVMGPNSYRICARTCTFTESGPRLGLITARRHCGEHQNLTAQFFMPKCIEWVNGRGDIYITSNDSIEMHQRLVHNIYFPVLLKYGTVDKIRDVLYRGHVQTVWKLNVDVFLKQLNQHERWT